MFPAENQLNNTRHKFLRNWVTNCHSKSHHPNNGWFCGGASIIPNGKTARIKKVEVRTDYYFVWVNSLRMENDSTHSFNPPAGCTEQYSFSRF